MNKQKWLYLAITLALLAATTAALNWLQTHQRLGVPGIRATPIPGSLAMDIALPTNILDYTSESIPEASVAVNMLPKDTSFVERRYRAPDGFWVINSVVLMGKDRTSIHKPEYCLPGQGWHINERSTESIPITDAHPYDLPVAKFLLSNTVQAEGGQKMDIRGIYLFWFVADNEQTTSHWRRILWLAKDLMTTGVLQRWAYVSYFAICPPGQEQATVERMKKIIAASVPQFQPAPQNSGTAVAARE